LPISRRLVLSAPAHRKPYEFPLDTDHAISCLNLADGLSWYSLFAGFFPLRLFFSFYSRQFLLLYFFLISAFYFLPCHVLLKTDTRAHSTWRYDNSPHTPNTPNMSVTLVYFLFLSSSNCSFSNRWRPWNKCRLKRCLECVRSFNTHLYHCRPWFSTHI